MNRRSVKKGKKPIEVIVRDVDVPPRDLTFPQGGQIFRFYFNSGQVNHGVTRDNLLSMLCYGVNNSAVGATIIQALLVTKLDLYSPPVGNVGSSSANASIVWYGVDYGARFKSDAKVGDEANFVTTKPPRNSPASFWSTMNVNNSETLFYISGNTGSILDIHCQVTLASTITAANETLATTAASTTRAMYFNALDQTTNAIRPMGGLNAIA